MKNKYYTRLPKGQWKVYLQLFTKKGTKQRLFLKPGITEYKDADARMYFNNILEEETFQQHFDTIVKWSKKYPNKEEAKKVEDELLEYFGDEVDMGFKTGGYTEVRRYDHEKYISKLQELYN